MTLLESFMSAGDSLLTVTTLLPLTSEDAVCSKELIIEVV